MTVLFLVSKAMNEVTRILNDGCDGTTERLFPLLYDELRRLAAVRMSQETPGQTIAATGLVHEAWLRLVGQDASWDSRGHFFAAASEAMRRILIDRARRRSAAKRGGDRARVSLDPESIDCRTVDQRLIALSEALTRFEHIDPAKAELVKLRYFAGCTTREAAQLLGISTATADRHWAYARAWLQRELSD